MKQLTLTFLLLLAVSFGHATPSKQITFVGFNFPPFFSKDSSGYAGAYVDIVKELCKAEGWDCTFKILPIRKALDMVATGKMELGGPFSFTSQRQLKFYYSPPLFKTHFVFIGNRRVVGKIHRYEDLKGLTVGVTYPTSTSISLERINDAAGGILNTAPERETMRSIIGVQQNKYPLAYVNRDVARHWIKDTGSVLVEVPNLGDETNYHLIISRLSFNDDEFSKINAHLNKMLEDKTIQKIADKYNLTAAR